MPKRKKISRPRTVASLAEREKIRDEKREREERERGFVREPKKRKIIPFNPDEPIVLDSSDTRFIIFRESRFWVFVADFPWKMLAVTLAIIFIGGVGSAAFQARNATIRANITTAERTYRELQASNFALNSELEVRYTHYEIERIATERLGMSFPDPSLIINIDVARGGGVTLNTDENVLPKQNYFWQDVGEFLSGIVNRVFGG